MTLNDLIRGAMSAELAKRGMSQRALARELGWSQTYMQNRMLGRYAFTTVELERVAEVLGVSVGHFIPAEALR